MHKNGGIWVRKKIIAVLLCGIVVFGTLVGCGSRQSEELDAQAEDDTQNEYAGNLTMMHFSTVEEVENTGAADGLRKMIDEWKKEHPEIGLSENISTNYEYKNQLSALANADNLPDVFMLQGMNTKEWASAGLILDMTDIVKQSPDYQNYKMDFFTAFRDDEGKIYAIPALTGGTCTVIIYDKQMWKDAGYDTFPDSWEEIKKADAYFESQGIDTILFDNNGKWQANSSFMSTVGNLYTGKEWFQSILKKEGAAFTDEAFVNALVFTQDIFQSGVFNDDVNAIDNDEVRKRYMEGAGAALVAGNWDVSYIMKGLKENNPAKYEQLGFAVLPTPEDAKGDTNCQNIGMGWGLAINAKLADEPEKLQAAIDLIYKLTGADYAKYVTENYALSGVTTAQNVDWSKFDQITRDFYDYSYVCTNTCEIYDSYLNEEVWDIFNTGLQELLDGKTDPETLARNTQRMYEDSY